jgi:hypothetical protein
VRHPNSNIYIYIYTKIYVHIVVDLGTRYGWILRRSNRCGGNRFSLPHTSPDRSWSTPSFVYNGYRGSFSGVKRQRRVVEQPSSSSAKVKVTSLLPLCTCIKCYGETLTLHVYLCFFSFKSLNSLRNLYYKLRINCHFNKKFRCNKTAVILIHLTRFCESLTLCIRKLCTNLF